MAPDPKPKKTEQVHPTSALQNGIPCSSASGVKKALVGSNPGLKRCLSACGNPSFLQAMARFCLQNQTYRFKCLPFGLSTAPRTFTRVVKVIAEHFRKQGMFIFADLDDWLLTAPSSPEILKSHLSRVLETVQNLGFIVNFKKSSLVPSQRLQFLGAILDFRRGMVFPSEERVSDTVDTASCLLQIESPPAGLWMRMLGLIASMEFILPLCLMRMRVIQLHALDNFNNQNSQSLMDYIIFSLCSFTNPFASSFAILK